MQNRWIRFVKGFLVIKVDGDYMERFFNMCRMHQIDLWEIKKEQDICMCEAYAADFLKMPPLLRKTGTKVHVDQKKDYFFCGCHALSDYAELCDGVRLGNRVCREFAGK